MWLSGRPSIKAYYPEIVILAVVTLVFLALGAKMSCSVIKNDSNKPKEASAAYSGSLFTNLAYAQDEAIELPAEEEPAAEAENVPVEPEAVPAAEVETAPVEPEVVPAADTAETAAPVADASSSAAQTASSSTKKGSVSNKTKLILIWILCLGVPLALWIWRGVYWLIQVYGTFYELRIDPDNPKATTFLVTRGILNKRTDSVHIGQIKDIASRQSFFQKYFKGGVGTIELYTPTDKTDGRIIMKDMAEPGNVFKAIDGLRAQYWGKGGMQLNSGASADMFDAEAENIDPSAGA